MPNQLSTEPAQVGPSSATDEFNEPFRSDCGSNSMPMVPLADAGGSERLAELEVVIERGLTTFIDVGAALLEIRDRRLYRDRYETFEAYCRARWDWGRNYVNKQIAAAEVVGLLGTEVPTPTSEAVARELVPLRDAPEEMARAWQQAVEQHGPKPTAKQMRSVIDLPHRRPVRQPASGPTRKPKAAAPADQSNKRREARLMSIANYAQALDQLARTPLPDATTCRRWRETLRPAVLILTCLDQELEKRLTADQ